jgi:hypothetical protein
LFLPVGRFSLHAPLTFTVAASNLADDFLMSMTHNTLLDSSHPGDRAGSEPKRAVHMVMEFWGAAV